jgi:hypothetical protein
MEKRDGLGTIWYNSWITLFSPGVAEIYPTLAAAHCYEKQKAPTTSLVARQVIGAFGYLKSSPCEKLMIARVFRVAPL